MCRGTLRRPGDDGQVATGLVVCALLGLATLLVLVLVPTSAATDQRSRAQNAADAAALAGAGGVLDGLEARLGDPLPGRLTSDEPSSAFDHAFYALFTGTSASGGTDADRLAAANGARVTSYRYDWWADRIEVQVQMNGRLEGGEQSQAAASAAIGSRFGRCRFTLPTPPMVPTPTATPSPDPSATATVTPTPGPVDLDLDCDGHGLHFMLDGGGRLRLTPPGQLRSWNRLGPRLVP